MQESSGLMGRLMLLACGLSLWMLMATAGVAAAELRKCRLSNGRPAYMSEACPAGSREVWQRDVAADPAHAAALKRRQDDLKQWEQASRREAALRLRAVAHRGSARHSTASAPSRCERAQARRDRIRDKDWMRMTYDRMIQLDDEVSEACR